MATDLEISTADQPGELARIGEALGSAGINIEGVCGLGSGGRGTIHVCVEDAAGARQAIEAAGLSVGAETPAIVTGSIPSAGEPGTLGQMAKQLGDAGINIRVLYVATGDRGVLVTDDDARAREILGV